jgi:hypothetical protein
MWSQLTAPKISALLLVRRQRELEFDHDKETHCGQTQPLEYPSFGKLGPLVIQLLLPPQS